MKKETAQKLQIVALISLLSVEIVCGVLSLLFLMTGDDKMALLFLFGVFGSFILMKLV